MNTKKILLVLTPLFLALSTPGASTGEFCEADCNCDTKVDLADLVVMRSEFMRTDCDDLVTCYADCNDDNQVNLGDLVILKSQFLSNDCPTSGVEWCNYPIDSSTTTTCNIEITYGRPGRRGIPFTCNDVIDFTLCSDCILFDPLCLMWNISPVTSWLSIDLIDDCCWRLIIGDCCQQPETIGEYEITVTDICNNTSDAVIIEIL